VLATTAKVIDQSPDSSLILLEPLSIRNSCSGCLKNCRQRLGVTTRLPGNYSGAIGLSVTLHDQMVLLTHSLLFPLLGFVAGGSLAHWIVPGEPAVIGGALVGLLVGVKSCKRQTLERLNISEIEDE
jgi:hypothetical protein